LPSSLTRVLPLTLGFSPRLPVSVCGTGTHNLARGFSWQCEIGNFATIFHSPSQLELHARRICLPDTLTAWAHTSSGALSLSYCVPPLLITIIRWYRNINLLSIAYAFRPRLRPRLTLRGRAFLRKPWAFGERDSHSFFATHTGILTSKRSTSPHGLTSQHLERSPTIVRTEQSAASVIRLAPVYFRRRVTRPVSYYALFKWWLLLSQHPGCLCNSTSFST
jgi:hypothetical protein